MRVEDGILTRFTIWENYQIEGHALAVDAAGRPVAVFAMDRSSPIEYGDAYFEKYVGYAVAPVAGPLNEARQDTVAGLGHSLLDCGIGSGQFLDYVEGQFAPLAGYDVNPRGVSWLMARGMWFNPYLDPAGAAAYDIWTFWDVLEHIVNPAEILALIRPGAHVAVSLPVFNDLEDPEGLARNKHFRLNEHWIYFSREGFVRYMDVAGFSIRGMHDREVKAGRESIGTFVFQKR